MLLNVILAALALLSLALTVWQWLVARRFPLHRRIASPRFTPAVTLLKPLKGVEPDTAACLRSWLAQDYPGEVQVLFGVASPDDPVCAEVRKLLAEFPQRDAQLILCAEQLGANAKVSTLIHLARLAKHEHLVVSDADVKVPPDFLANALAPLEDKHGGLVSCFYCLANPTTPAMQWEAVAINADFWSSVLQARSLKPLDFALGAVMATRRAQLAEIGGFESLVDCLADDYQLGHQIAARGHRIELCPVVVECWSSPMNWREVWAHQLRWARTIRVCQPVPWFLSILSNATLWPVLAGVFAVVKIREAFRLPLDEVDLSNGEVLVLVAGCFYGLLVPTVRLAVSWDCQRWLTRSTPSRYYFWLAPIKDLLQAAIWALSFLGNTVTWRGVRYRVHAGGRLEKL
ncbi:MAG: glycosyltransferase [Verrucomicrobia bacterium]|nr:glycosyltransferase [Verrucomicrobiota bacterium]